MELPSEFGYVLLVFVFLFFVYQWMSVRVMAARKAYKVPYPLLYAPESNPNAKAFNCVQRGHQNSLEQLPWLLSFLFAAGVFYPVTAAVAGLVVTLGRIAYFLGYSSGDPDKRMRGGFGYLGLFTLLGSVIAAAASLLRGTA